MAGGWRRPAATVLASAAIGLASVPMLAGPVQAAPTTTSVTMACSTLGNPFSWDAEITASAVGDGTETGLTLAFSNLPGVSPAPLNDLAMNGTVNVSVGGTAVTLTGTKNVTAAARAPIPTPPVSANFASTATSLDVTLTKAVFTVSGIETSCTVTPAASVGPVEVETGAVPTPTPTPTPTATATPTPTPTPTKTAGSGTKKGVPAKGTAKFSCTLETLGSPFTYDPKVTMSGSREKAGDSKVSLRATFTDIPGLAPLPIENGTMKINAEALVGGKKVSFSSTSTVNVATKAKVPVPTLTSSVTTDEEKLSVEITAFKFDFGEMSGIQIYSDCDGGGKLSAMTVGVGDDADGGGSGGGGGGAAASGDSLPKTGAGAPLLMIGMWSSAFVLLAVAMFLFLPRRIRQSTL